MAATHRTPGYFSSAVRVFDLSISEMLWSRRTIFMALVVGAPVVISLLLRLLDALGAPVFQVNGTRMAGPAIFGMMIWVFYLRFTVPVLGVFYGTSLIADEVEDKTITYLFVRPIRRGAVLLGKYLAYVVCTVFVVLPSIVLVYLLVVPINGRLGASFLDLLKDLALIAVALAVYGAVFAFVGAKMKRPLLFGLGFIFGWEKAVMFVPGYLRRFTVAYYIQGLVPHTMPNTGVESALLGLLREIPTLMSSVFWLGLIWVVFLALGAWVVERREYVLEQ